MGCAVQDTAHQLNTNTENKIDRIEMPPNSATAEKQRSQGLKESHSTLLKLLESAPIGGQAGGKMTTTENNSFKGAHHQHYRKRKDDGGSSGASSIFQPQTKTENFSSLAASTSFSTIAPPAAAVADEANDKFVPWKKTRLAKEWRENSELLATAENGKKRTSEQDTDDDSMSECEHHRRNSSDSSEYGQNDSGCDSDCPDNINELCKNFNEKLSEEDVGLENTQKFGSKFFFKPFKKPLLFKFKYSNNFFLVLFSGLL